MSHASNYKTVMCSFWETGCPRASKCVFAHSVEELNPRMCPYGNRCHFDRRNLHFDRSRRACGFFHPGEVVTPQELFRRATEFTVAKPPATERVVKTKLCPSWEIGCGKSDCTFAHAKDELSPVTCKHGAKCFFNPKNPRYDSSRRPCTMHHPGDSFSQDGLMQRELARLGALQKLETELLTVKLIPKFVVRMEDDDEDDEQPAPVSYSIASIVDWADDEEQLDYSIPVNFQPLPRQTDADLTEVDMDLSE